MRIRQGSLFIVGFMVYSLLATTPAWAAPKQSAGKVTQINGTATLYRVDVAKPISVHFRDDVFLKDRIHTQEQSLVRVLLGGRALVTVRELSVLTITEAKDHATITIKSGTVGLSVARNRMKPGEYIEINTPHAIAAVRGTQLLTNVADQTNFKNLPEGEKKTDPTGKPKGVNVTCLKSAQPTQSIIAGEKVEATNDGACKKSPMTPQEIARAQKAMNPEEYGDMNSDAPEKIVKDHTDKATKVANQILGDEKEKEELLTQEVPTIPVIPQNPGMDLTTVQAQQSIVDGAQSEESTTEMPMMPGGGGGEEDDGPFEGG